MDKSKRDKPLSWGVSDHQEFELWVERNYPLEFDEWAWEYSGLLELYEYLEREEYEVLDEWLGHE